jgi:hypothetical protein
VAYAAASGWERAARCRQPWQLVFPLLIPPMWSDEALLKLISAQYHDCKLQLELAPIAELIVGSAENLPRDLELKVEADYVFLDTDPRLRMAQGELPKTVEPKPVQIAHKLAAQAQAKVHPSGAEALRQWFGCVDAGQDVELAQEQGLFDSSLDESPTLLRALVHRMQHKAIAEIIVQNPAAAQLWTRFAKPDAALLTLNAPKYVYETNGLEYPEEVLHTCCGKPEPCKAPEKSAFSTQILPQVQCASFSVDERSKQKFDLHFGHPCSLLLLAFTCDDDAVCAEPDAHPFLSVRLLIQGQELLSSDPVKAHEWNWLRCGVPAPAAGQKMYLLPFSKHALNWTKDGLPCTTNFSKIMEAYLELERNPAVRGEWTMQVAAVNVNVGVYTGGMFAMRYTR